MKTPGLFARAGLAAALMALCACPPPDDLSGPNYGVTVAWGDYCSKDRLSMDVYQILVNGVSHGENIPRTSSSFSGLPQGQVLLTIRYIPKPFSDGCGGYFIALDGGALFEDGSQFVSGKMDLAVEMERSYRITVPPIQAAK